jgi:hypothetical protein
MIRNSLVRLAPVALLLATAAAGTAQAATDGSLGATSTGTVTINATIASRVQIGGLNDVTIASIDPNTPETHAQDVCVWSNTAGKKYNIRATGSGISSAFTIGSGSLDPVNYTVEWAQSVGQNGGTSLASGTTLTGQASTATNPTCASGGESASLIVKMDTTNLQNMQAGATYTGVLTLLVAPE